MAAVAADSFHMSPAIPDFAENVPAEARQPRDEHRPAVILCIDDEPMGLGVRKAVLAQAGHVVRVAKSGEEGLRLFATEAVDLVVSDHLLRDTTGTRVAMQMKQLNPRIPILILSGLTETPDGMEFADCFLCKLEPPQVFLATVRKLLDEGQRTALPDHKARATQTP